MRLGTSWPPWHSGVGEPGSSGHGTHGPSPSEKPALPQGLHVSRLRPIGSEPTSQADVLSEKLSEAKTGSVAAASVVQVIWSVAFEAVGAVKTKL
jgi:hypothetical protein